MPDKPALAAKDVIIEKEEIVYQGYFRVDRYTLKHRQFEGSWSPSFTREVFERGHAVCCVLFDPVLDAVVLIEQFRIGAYAGSKSAWFDDKLDSPWLLEHIAGIIGDGETPEEVARREALEEAGIQVKDMVFIQKCFLTPGGSSESCHIFIGKVDASNAGGIHGLDEEHEDIKVHVVPLDRAFTLLDQGRCSNAITIIGLQWLRLNHARLKAAWA